MDYIPPQLLGMRNRGEINYDDGNKYEFFFDDFTVCIEKHTDEVAEITFKTVEGRKTARPEYLSLFNAFGSEVRATAYGWYIIWSGTYSLVENHYGGRLMQFGHQKQQSVHADPEVTWVVKSCTGEVIARDGVQVVQNDPVI